MAGRHFIMGMLFILAATTSARSQVGDSALAKGESPGSTFLVLPALGYTPETRFFGGIVGGVIWGSESYPQKSSVTALMIYSQNKQIQSGVSYELFLKDGELRIAGETYFLRWPDKFYGIGNTTPSGAEENYSDKFVRSLIGIYHKVATGLSLGLEYELRSCKVTDMMSQGSLADNRLTGVAPYFGSGLGVTVIYDTRDDNFVPLRGLYVVGGGRWFARAFGSDVRFSRYTFDGRAYLPVAGEHVVGFNLYIGGVTDGAPFQMLALAGGESRGRGYYFGRYRDNTLMSGQVEYRSPLVARIGLVLFGGITEVAPSLGRLSAAGIHPFAGVGIRFRLLQAARVNLRFDIGFGDASSGNYIGINEAF